MINASSEFLSQCRSALSAEQKKSLADTANWSHVDRPQVHADWDALYKKLSAILDDSSPSTPDVQAIIAQHYSIACRFYVPTKEAYIGMALFYEENENMRDFHNSYHPRMVNFLGQAIYVYAQSLHGNT